MIDLHCHLLPAVDDGAADLEEAVSMCSAAAADGCTAIVATPHLRHERWWNGDRLRLEELWRRLEAAAADHLQVHLGGEIAINSESADELLRLPEGDLLSLAGSRYLLLEFHPRGIGPDPEDLVHELAISGWFPVIAHPERIPWLAEDLGYLAALSDLGALVQITAMSVTGEIGRFTQNAAERMLEDEMVHFIASDAHDCRIRRPGLSRAFGRVADSWGEAKARELFIENPRAVLSNSPLRRPLVGIVPGPREGER